MSNDGHAERTGAAGDLHADVPESDDAERFTVQLRPHELLLFPLAGFGRFVGLRHQARQREHQGQGMLGDRDGVAARRVHDDTPLAVAASTSTLSTPIPARPIARSFGAWSRTSFVIFVALRQTMASASARCWVKSVGFVTMMSRCLPLRELRARPVRWGR